MIPVILSGGSGSRLWPLSRKQFPKQFLALTGEHTLFQQTLERLVFDGMDTPIVVCNKDHRFIVNEQLSVRKLEAQRILMEPFGRNTAPAVALTAMMLVNEGRDELMLVLPADHVIDDQKALQRALALATVAAERGEMVLFGVPATRPETGYGYIKSANDSLLPEGVSRVQQFVEKPDEKRAVEFVKSGGYFWNSGMFLFRASRYPRGAGAASAPDIVRQLRADAGTHASGRADDGDFVRLEPGGVRLPARIRFDRLRGDGEDRARAAWCRWSSGLERRGQLGGAVGRGNEQDDADGNASPQATW
jgi:mannose-1-phosphate guanylyltransferase/mannose-6-phosphate isomerase